MVILAAAVAPAGAASKHEAQFDRLCKSYALNPDGSQEFRVQKQLTIFTHAAMNSLYGETFIEYDPSYQELVIHESYTVQKDGTVIQTPANAFVEVLPSAAANSVAYNRLKEMVIVHTGLELGATIYLDYSVITKAGALPALDIFEPVEELSPIKEYVMSISVPSGTPLHYELLNGKAAPVVTDTDGVTKVTWTLRDVSPRPRFLAVSVEAGNLQAVTATTFASRDDILNCLRSQAYSTSDPAVTALFEKLNSGRDRRSIMDKIDGYVNAGLDRSALTLSQTGYRLRPVADVISSAYATAAERAFLADVLLRSAGMEHQVLTVFPVTEDSASAGLASLKSIACHPVGVDKVHQDLMSLPGFVTVCNLDGEPEETSAGSSFESTSTLKISRDEGTDLGSGLRAYRFPQKDSPWLSEVYAGTTANTTRPVNLLLPYLPDERLEYTLIVEEEMTPVALPRQRNISNSVGSVTVSIEELDGNTVVVNELSIDRQLLTPEEYPLYYALMEEWYGALMTPIVYSE